jgi:hypothetical protein
MRTSRLSLSGRSPTQLGQYPDSVRIPTNQYDTGDKSTCTAGLTTANMLFNSAIFMPGARFLVIDIKNIYLNTPPGRSKYVVVLMSSLPQEVIGEYDLNDLTVDGKVYIEIHKGMYGLPQVGIIANECLQ